MSQLAWRILTAVNMLLMLVIFAVSVFLGGCDTPVALADGGSAFKNCHWAFMANSVISVAGLFVGLVGQFAKGDEGRRFSSIMIIVVYIILAIMPSPLVIGICDDVDACKMAAFITWAACVIGVIISVIQIARANPDK